MVERVSREAEKKAIATVRRRVELALQRFGTNDVALSSWIGKLSTNPQLVSPDVTYETLYDKCVDFSRELRRCLKQVGQPTQISTSAFDLYTEPHLYLTTTESGIEIIIDPTIGQFVQGYSHVFVGTRAELRDIVCRQTLPGGSYRLQAGWRYETPRHVFFEVMWGTESRPPASV